MRSCEKKHLICRSIVKFRLVLKNSLVLSMQEKCINKHLMNTLLAYNLLCRISLGTLITDNNVTQISNNKLNMIVYPRSTFSPSSTSLSLTIFFLITFSHLDNLQSFGTSRRIHFYNFTIKLLFARHYTILGNNPSE